MVLPKKLLIGFPFAVLLIVALGLFSLGYVKEVISPGERSNLIKRIYRSAQDARTMLLDVDRKLFGFQATGHEQFLNHAEKRTNLLLSQMEEISNLAAFEPELKSTVEQLDEGVAAFAAMVAVEKLEVNNSGQPPARRQSLVEELNLIFKTLEDQLMALERDQQSSLTAGFYRFVMALSALLVANILIIVLLFFGVKKAFTDRLGVEQQLIKTNGTLTELYEAAPCGYMTVNGEGMVVKMNQSLLTWLGYKREEVVDRMHVSNLLPSWSHLVDKWPVGGLNVSQGGEESEPEILMKNGGSMAILASVADTPTLRSANEYNITLVDYSERKKIKESLKQTNKDLEAFSYSISHDLRAPLRAINSYALILKEEYGDKVDQEGMRLLDVVIKNARDMGQLIEDLLRLSKTGRQEVIKAEVDHKALVEDIVKDIAGQEDLDGVCFDIADLGTALADAGLIRQVWVNLISNAIKYSKKTENAHIEIGAYQEECERIFYVKDNGVGFDMKYCNKLFGVFQRLHHRREFDGTGVGLSLVKRIIENHNGRVWAEAEVDRGATFYFSLPET